MLEGDMYLQGYYLHMIITKLKNTISVQHRVIDIFTVKFSTTW